jgi:hypothetical protein
VGFDLVMPDADVAESVHDALFRQDMIGGDQVVDEGGIDI